MTARQEKKVRANQPLIDADPIISVVIPAFNEEASLGSVLERSHRSLQDLGMSYELIVVDDGSTDKTAHIAAQHGVRLISNIRNRGKGYSLKRGFQAARGVIVITMDADGSHLPEEIPLLLSPIVGDNPSVDAVIGSRFCQGFDPSLGPRLHYVGNRIFNTIIFVLTGKSLRDSQCGFRAFKSEILAELVTNESGYEIETRMLVKILRNGYSFKELPVTYTKRLGGVSKIRTFRDGSTILLSILRAFFD